MHAYMNDVDMDTDQAPKSHGGLSLILDVATVDACLSGKWNWWWLSHTQECGYAWYIRYMVRVNPLKFLEVIQPSIILWKWQERFTAGNTCEICSSGWCLRNFTKILFLVICMYTYAIRFIVMYCLLPDKSLVARGWCHCPYVLQGNTHS